MIENFVGTSLFFAFATGATAGGDIALASPEGLIALLTLTALELVLGIDNIIFISILADKLPPEQRAKARYIGLGLALGTRVLLLLSLSWIIGLTFPLFTIPYLDLPISGRDLILILGGLFLIAKSTYEIHESLEGEHGHASAKVHASFTSVIIQILLLDIIFSLDSVITAVGMVNNILIMIIAVVISIVFMIAFAAPLGNFVSKHPTIKILALSFLLLIGMTLLGEGFQQHIPKGYIYFAMGFSVFVEFLNMRVKRGKTPPVDLHERYVADNETKIV